MSASAPAPAAVPMAEIARSSGVEFGTSGVRGLVAALDDRVAYAYTTAFLQYLERAGALGSARRIALGGDLRASTERILRAAARAVRDRGLAPLYAGRLPTPALAFYGITRGVPTIMVTGSHIPDDRNGIKFTLPSGEILKADEAGIAGQSVELAADFGPDGAFETDPGALAAESPEPLRAYVARYLDAFPAAALAGTRVGVYGHSSVAREILVEILEGLGARVLRLGWSDRFVPVDTEAVRAEDVELVRAWAQEHRPFAIVSTDGDADRPLVADERGAFLRGDVLGPLVARFFDATFVAASVSSSSVLERSGWFHRTTRTRIGSPYVIEALLAARAAGEQRAVGYEANGGFLTATELRVPGVPGVPDGAPLAPLPTRDSVIVHLALLVAAKRRGLAVSDLLAELPPRFTASDRLKDFPSDRARPRLAEIAASPALAVTTFPGLGELQEQSTLDGLRLFFENGEIVHVRPSGNAPELRCYVEADTEARARTLLASALDTLKTWR